MKIGIDISQIVYKGTGVAVYTRSLVESLLKIDNDDQFVLFGSSLRNRGLLKEFTKGLSAKNQKRRFSILPPKLLEFLWNGIHIFPIEGFVGKIDVFHSSDWLEPPVSLARKVTTIHDLAVFKYPETFFPRGGHDIVSNQKRKLHFVKQDEDFIIAVSENTKKDIIETLKIPEKRIKVIYEAADPVYFPREENEIANIKKKFGMVGDYILCVGTREPRKNLERVITAFAEISKANENLSLVIVGKYGWGDEKLKVKSEKLKVRILGFVEKEDLAGLYSGALAFAYPSLYEGFGLPILEAMSCKCPVITSNLGSMKEIAGHSALLVDPESVSEIAGAISQIIRNQKSRNELIEEGEKRAKEFSWEKTALQTLNLYKSLLE